MSYCEECHQDTKHGEHEPWCSRGDPGERPPAALLWARIEEQDEKINRLAQMLGLPPDWDGDHG